MYYPDLIPKALFIELLRFPCALDIEEFTGTLVLFYTPYFIIEPGTRVSPL